LKRLLDYNLDRKGKIISDRPEIAGNASIWALGVGTLRRQTWPDARISPRQPP